jgi:hypothetical protein
LEEEILVVDEEWWDSSVRTITPQVNEVSFNEDEEEPE